MVSRHGSARRLGVFSTTSLQSQNAVDQSIAGGDRNVAGTGAGASTAPATTSLPAPTHVVSIAVPTTTGTRVSSGIADDGKAKPDANGAGGADNYVETVNASLAIYSRTGVLEKSTTLQSWFHVPSTAFVVDPVVVWDDTGMRFLISADLGYELVLSVAQQTDERGGYCTYAFPTPSNLGADFDKLGVNSAGIYLSANLLKSSTGSLVSNELFFANRAQLESCAPNTNYTIWTGLTNPSGTIAEAIVPMVQEDGQGGTEYLVNSSPSGGCRLTLWVLDTTNAALSNTSIPTQCYSPPPLAQQEGSTLRLGTGDCSLTQASYLGSLITVALPASYNWGNGQGSVSIVEWFVLNPTSAGVSAQGAFGAPGYSLFLPAAVRNSIGHMLFVFNASGPTIYPSIWYVNSNPSSTVALAWGNSYFTQGTGAPWGDYNSAWVDVSGGNPSAIWMTGEYAQATNTWGTEFELVTP